eukprot:INCI17416.1.p1 GENE.INCI17416.1~~INCI17416.1.p1  ORF type:complete len:705 (-),score=61.48 INCI17416.1:1190-3274(-)
MSADQAAKFVLPEPTNNLKCGHSVGGTNVELDEAFWDSLLGDQLLSDSWPVPPSHQSRPEVIDLTSARSETQHCEESSAIDIDMSCLSSSPTPSNAATTSRSSDDITSPSVRPALTLLPDRPIDESCQALIAQMVEVCHCKPAAATQYLRATNWNLERSVALCFERGADVTSSTFHEAVSFADTICSEFADAKVQIPQFIEVDLVARDTVVTWAANFSRTQARLARAGRDTRARVFFHWTSARTLSSIAEHGLLTKSGREKASVKAVSHGAVFGDGLYLANHPQDFRGRYGEVCLVCVCVLGKHERVWGHKSASVLRGIRTGQSPTSHDSTPLSDTEVVVDTIIGNKGSPRVAFPDEVVLHSPGQCIPIFSVGRSSFEASAGKKLEEFLVGDFSTWLCNVVHNCFDHITTKRSNSEYQPVVPRRLGSRRRRIWSAQQSLPCPVTSASASNLVAGTGTQRGTALPTAVAAPVGLTKRRSVLPTAASSSAEMLSLFETDIGPLSCGRSSPATLTSKPVAAGTLTSSGSISSACCPCSHRGRVPAGLQPYLLSNAGPNAINSSTGCSCNQMGSELAGLQAHPLATTNANSSFDFLTSLSGLGSTDGLVLSGPSSAANQRSSGARGAHDIWKYNPKCAASNELTLESARQISGLHGASSNPGASTIRKRKVSDAASAAISRAATEACEGASSRKMARK